ncbi:hypothetical protein KIN20_037541 [Parelaphostrongylus tenuis]|uniref:Uncharacterized protein n=1 Tax=Parelaphostrongylus tenuis TaxID=148309 RepID=A0AAD5REQ5_PARTN|nr:hypothetical protein KIN20_037541 [Parelaphostrongylus tenuis]
MTTLGTREDTQDRDIISPTSKWTSTTSKPLERDYEENQSTTSFDSDFHYNSSTINVLQIYPYNLSETIYN